MLLTVHSGCAQLAGAGLWTPDAPLTLAKQTAVLTVFEELLPPIFFLGLAPQWTRVAAVTSDAAASTANVSLLMETYVPPIYYDARASDSFAQVTVSLASSCAIPLSAPVPTRHAVCVLSLCVCASHHDAGAQHRC